jgi:peptidyl-prolyl cis-trans isomerase B (cyclophilin B)
MSKALVLLASASVCALFLPGCEPPSRPLPPVSEGESPEPVKPGEGDPFADNRLDEAEMTEEMKADIAKSQPKEGENVAVITTNKGEIVVMLYPEIAPKTVENFTKLANDKFYEGVRFHRTIAGFMIQGGDPESKDLANASAWGSGGPDYSINDELNPIKHEAGVLSMAHAGPNTGGSQFFIMTGTSPNLDYLHTGFGRVIKGMDAVKKIEQTPVTDGNGTVVPEEAAVIKSVVIKPWPLS